MMRESSDRPEDVASIKLAGKHELGLVCTYMTPGIIFFSGHRIRFAPAP